MQAERERRKQILDTQAQVNIAEGSKQKAILASEGASQAELNRAHAERKKLIMESEGHREAAINDGRALASGGPVTAETRAEALRAIVEMRRIEQLQAIAHGPGNSTYFFGDRSTMAGDIWHPDGEKRVRASFSRTDADVS
jgi:regulator of protease activity HflC (stomatin/prohibitin superfamily)